MNLFFGALVYPSRAATGGWRVAGYRHYRLDGAGNIVEAKWLEASDDDDAVRQVREQQFRFASELWRGDRLVARIDAPRRDS